MRCFIAKISLLQAIPLGVTLGAISYFSAGLLFVTTLALLTVYFISYLPDKEERDFLIRLFTWGLIAHFLVAVVMHFALIVIQRNFLFNDEFDNVNRAWLMNKLAASDIFQNGERILQWNGNLYSMSQNFKFGLYNQHLHIFLLFFWITLFGDSVLAIISFNCFIACVTALIGYFLAKQWFNKSAARIAGILICFFPTLFLWSLTALKETLFVMFVLLSYLAFSYLLKTKKIIYIILLFGATYAMFLMRDKTYFLGLFLVFMFFYAIYFTFTCRKVFVKRTLFLLLCIIFIYGIFRHVSLLHMFKIETLRFFKFHVGVVHSGGFVYHVLPESFYSPYLQIYDWPLAIAVRYVIFSLINFFTLPHFWSVHANSQLIYYPMMILWWSIMFFFWVGVFFAFQDRNKNVIYSFWVIFCIMFLLAMTGGNIGTLIRHRDMVTPVIMIFFSYAISKLFVLEDKQ